MVTDPVCHMTLDPAEAAASEVFEGERFHFCSKACHRRFLADPSAYASKAGSPLLATHHHAPANGAPLQQKGALTVWATGVGALASLVLLGFYFGVLTLVSGWAFTADQFIQYWPFITALAVGFGIQVGLFTYLRRAVHAAASGKVMAATGTTSGAAMVSCCTHYLVNLLPALGATGLVSFVAQYQTELFWFGIAANLAGIAFIGRRVVLLAQGV